jgi:hypothetical protein
MRSVAFSQGRRHWPHEAADNLLGHDVSNAARTAVGWVRRSALCDFYAKPNLKGLKSISSHRKRLNAKTMTTHRALQNQKNGRARTTSLGLGGQ